ncbi:hypothetical protein KJ359_013177 [Pestalotiopsis sp. 9143b]|nr:hypothetical protein KJ359_013177 [Pestalotiopsis sp. 9143b]
MPARFPLRLPATPGGELQSLLPHPDDCQLLEANDQRQIWAVGDKYTIKGKKYHDGCKLEVDNVKFVQTHTYVPSPAVSRSWRDGERFFTLQRRVPGETLEKMLPQLTEQELIGIGEDLGRYLFKIRRIQNNRMEMINGTGVVDQRLLPSVADRFSVETDEELAGLLAYRIRGKLDDNLVEEFMSKMPTAKPFTFSHSDLHEANIMVKDGKFSGLIDWDLAGYYPVWWESVNRTPLLDPYLPPALACPQALRWFDVYQAVRDAPGESETLAKLGEWLYKRE